MQQPTANTRIRGGRYSRRGFTLVEAIVVIIILGIIAAVVAPRLLQRIGQSKRGVAVANASNLASAMNNYIIDVGTPPDSGQGLDALYTRPSNVEEAAWKGPYVENADALLDPWGKPFMLKVPGEFNTTFDILSYGADGQPGGEGDNEDVINGKK